MKNQLLILLTLIFYFLVKKNIRIEHAFRVNHRPIICMVMPLKRIPFFRLTNCPKKLKKLEIHCSSRQGTIKEVCIKKGCWMTLSLENDSEMMVRFKDYGFFVPLDASGEVLIHGKAFISETSVDDLRHYAEDAGASDDEIAAVTT